MLTEKFKLKVAKAIERVKGVKKRTKYCILVGVILAVLSFALNKKSIYVGNGEIERTPYGTQKKAYKIKVDADNLSNNIEFSIAVSPKKYSIDEANGIFNKKIEELEIQMLNENEDYEHVSNKLNFAQDLGDGVKASYTFEPSKKGTASDFAYFIKYQGLIDGSGNVNNNDFKTYESCTGFIEAQLSVDIKDSEVPYKSEKVLIPVKVVAKKMTPLESFKNSFTKEVAAADRESLDKDIITLPKVVNDYKVHYKDKLDLSFLLMILFGVFASILLEARDREKAKEAKKNELRLLELDFSQIITKLLLYVNSGMTIRNSMIRLAEQYQIKKKDKRVAYDELILVKNKLLSGYNEIKAYEEMAKNINLRNYTRFLNILIQSIKNGNKELKNILNMEVQDALYERKQHAKKLGEEAATKLVLPLMMMLAVIMVVIMVPAFMGM